MRTLEPAQGQSKYKRRAPRARVPEGGDQDEPPELLRAIILLVY